MTHTNASHIMTMWEVGEHSPLYKPGVWAFYFVGNTFGGFLCLLVIYGVYLLGARHRRSTDICVAGIMSGCASMSLTCAAQCFTNLIFTEWTGGEVSCRVEAYAHIVSIMVMFAFITVVSAVCCLGVVYGVRVSQRQALITFGATWLFVGTGTGIFAAYSPIYLVPSGVFCFFEFDSALMLTWFGPVMLLAAAVVIYCYTKIFRAARSASDAVEGMDHDKSRRQALTASVARKSIVFPLTFVVGWLPAVVLIVWELSIGHITPALDTTAGVCATLHSTAVAICYGLLNRSLMRALANRFTWLDCIVRQLDKAGHEVTRYQARTSVGGGPHAMVDEHASQVGSLANSSAAGHEVSILDSNGSDPAPRRTTQTSHVGVAPLVRSVLAAGAKRGKLPEHDSKRKASLADAGGSLIITVSAAEDRAQPPRAMLAEPRVVPASPTVAPRSPSLPARASAPVHYSNSNAGAAAPARTP